MQTRFTPGLLKVLGVRVVSFFYCPAPPLGLGSKVLTQGFIGDHVGEYYRGHGGGC